MNAEVQTQLNIELLANAIASKINVVPFDKRLLNPDEAAEYLKVSRTYLMNTLQNKPDFPKAVSFTSDKRRGYFVHPSPFKSLESTGHAEIYRSD